MAKTPKKKQQPEDVELRPDGWERFERQMDKIVPPKTRKETDRARKSADKRN